MKRQSFITGAFLLAVATGLGKIFSAIFKIPLDRLFLHADGMAVFNSAYNVYMFFFAAATAGVPLAISHLVAGASSKKEEESIVNTAWSFLSVVLTAVAFSVFFFADTIAAITGMPEAALSFRAMAPALLFCGTTATMRGFFQGKMSMLPSAASQVADSFGRLLLGFGMAFLFSKSALSVEAAGAISGVPLGALLSAAILLFAFFKNKNTLSLSFSLPIIKKILLLALPITLTASLHQIFNLTDTISVVPLLKYFSFSEPQRAFGCLSRAVTLYALPVSIATAVTASILPAVTQSAAKNDTDRLVCDVSMAIRLALIISVPCAAGFIAIPHKILNMLFDNTSYQATLPLIAPSAVFLSAGSVLSGILQGLGKTSYTLTAACIAVFAKIILNPVLISFMSVNGAAAATSCSYMIFLVLLVIFAFCKLKLRINAFNELVKPLFCGFLCYITASFCASHMHTAFAICLTAAVFAISVFATKLVTFREFRQIFAGNKSPLNTD